MWKQVPDKTKALWKQIQNSLKCDKNYKALRELTRETLVPAVPYLGMFLSDLTFTNNEDNFIDNTKMINFVKLL